MESGKPTREASVQQKTNTYRHYVESGQISSLSCWLFVAARPEREDARSGAKSPMDRKLQPSTSDSMVCFRFLAGYLPVIAS